MSIYLPGFVRDAFTSSAHVDFDALRDAVAVAMRLSDDLIDIELEKLREIVTLADTDDERRLFEAFIRKAELGRRTGLGSHGLGDMLAQLGYKYDTPEAVDFVRNLMLEFKLAAYAASVNLARERGPFPMWDPMIEAECEFLHRLADEDESLADYMSVFGRRNGALLTLAPTGSISILSRNCSSGVEPMFMAAYDRKRKVDAAKAAGRTDLYRDAMGDYWETYRVFHANVERWLKLAHENPTKYGTRSISFGAGVQDYTVEEFTKLVTDKGLLPSFFVGANDIDWRQRVAMQAAIQEHIDHSISSTINLPAGTTPETVAEIYLAAWKAGTKGVTVYVDGSREAQVLSSGEQKGETVAVPVAALAAAHEAEIDIAAIAQQLGTAVDTGAIMDKIDDLLKTPCPPDCLQPTSRGTTTEGQMVKASFRHADTGDERKVYVYIGTNEEGRPVEAFLIDEAGDEDLIPYGAAVGKLVSLALKHGIPSEAVENTLIGLKGGSISFSGKVYNSVPDLVGKRLRAAREEWEEGQVLDAEVAESVGRLRSAVDAALGVDPAARDGEETVIVETDPTGAVTRTFRLGQPAGQLLFDTGDTRQPTTTVARAGFLSMTCPSCQGTEVRKIDGCPSCTTCGWSRCS